MGSGHRGPIVETPSYDRRIAPTARRVRSAEELLPLLEPHEPAATLVAAPLVERGVCRRVKAWVVEENGTALGALVVSRLCADRWRAYPFLFDPRAAQPLAELIERTPAYVVFGPEDHVTRLVPHIQRFRGLLTMQFLGTRTSAGKDPAGTLDQIIDDDRARPATRDDLDALVELFRSYELDSFPTVPRLRRFLDECFDLGRPIAVVEVDAQIVGAMRIDARSRQFAYLSGQSVLPEHRGSGLGHALVGCLATALVELRLGAIAVRAVRSPVQWPKQFDPEWLASVVEPSVFEGADVFAGTWNELWVHRRVRVRGAGRVRKLIERVEGPIRKRPPPAPYPQERPTPQ